MDHVFFLNTNSFPAGSADEAYDLFADAIQGMLALNNGSDRYTLFAEREIETLLEIELAVGFSYSDFVDRLVTNGEDDLRLFLAELDDKSPALDHIDSEVFEEALSYDFYLPGYAVPEYPEVLGFAYFLSASLLSMRTSEQWADARLRIARTGGGQYRDEKLSLYNVGCLNHGKEIKSFFSDVAVDIRQIATGCELSEELVNWHNDLSEENRRRVIDKLQLACEREFRGGKPLFKQLQDAKGLREIRFDAYSGGAIRILFKPLPHAGQAVLLGFIKKSKNEGYEQNIKAANRIYSAMAASIE